tara:strand:+ start:18 stop:362 length:345 start_codon:yes stop_codon:yes gene_type:complete
MAHSKPTCSSPDVADTYFDPELRAILNALFCICLEDPHTSNVPLRRRLFQMTEFDGQPLKQAANTLGIDHLDAKTMLRQTRREIVVLMAVGLGAPSGAISPEGPLAPDCFCGDT